MHLVPVASSVQFRGRVLSKIQLWPALPPALRLAHPRFEMSDCRSGQISDRDFGLVHIESILESYRAQHRKVFEGQNHRLIGYPRYQRPPTFHGHRAAGSG
jgi:hypothetical protein